MQTPSLFTFSGPKKKKKGKKETENLRKTRY